MGYDFPNFPEIGLLFAPPDGPTWQWDGTAWRSLQAAPPTASEVSVGDTLPLIGSWNGQLWWESDSGKLFVWYDDGTSTQWVQILAPALISDVSSGTVIATGGTTPLSLADWFAGLGRIEDPPEVGFWADQGPVNVWRMRDRVFVGDACKYDANFTLANGTWLGEPEVTAGDGNANQNWLEHSAQLYSNHTQGGIAILGATRSGDTEGGAITGQTPIAVAGYAYGDADPSSVWGGYFSAVRGSAFTGRAYGAQVDVKNLGVSQINNAYAFNINGGTYGISVFSGGNSVLAPLAANDSTAAVIIGGVASRWIKGIVFQADGLSGTDGTGTGKGIAMEMARGQALKWRHALLETSTSAEIRSDNDSAANETRIVFGTTGLLVKCMDGSQTSEVTIAEFPVNAGASLYPSISSGMAGISINVGGTPANGNISLAPKGTGNVTTPRNLWACNATGIPVGGALGTGLLLSSVANFGINFGSGAPLVSAAKGTFYLRSDGAVNARAYVNNNGSFGWSALVDDISGKLDIAHAGSGGTAHANVVAGGLAGFMTGTDKLKLDGLTAGGGAFIDRFYMTPGSFTWTKPAGLAALEVWVQGSGGGGGGAGSGAGQTAVGAGGAAGGGARRFYDATEVGALAATVAIVVGVGGAGGADTGAAGVTGNSSSFGTVSASGGAGGNTSGANALDSVVGGASGGIGTGGDENIMGGPGNHGIKFASPPYKGIGGTGGGAAGGGGGAAARTTSDLAGFSGLRGSGGGGGYSANGGAGSEGGVGGDGYVRVREYY